MSARYDPLEDSWEELPPMKTPRVLAGSVVFKDKIYIIGECHLLINILLPALLPIVLGRYKFRGFDTRVLLGIDIKSIYYLKDRYMERVEK